jgi:hypothetical protein
VNTQAKKTNDADGAIIFSLEETALDLKVHRLIDLDAKIKAALDARAELADEIIEQIGEGTRLVDGIKVTIVRPIRRVIDIAKLEAVTSRRLFAKLTERVVSLKAYDAHLAAGTAGIEAVAEIVDEVPAKPSLRITK